MMSDDALECSVPAVDGVGKVEFVIIIGSVTMISLFSFDAAILGSPVIWLIAE